MKTVEQLITELFDKPYKWTSKNKTGHSGRPAIEYYFQSDSLVNYVVVASYNETKILNLDANTWEIFFYADGSYRDAGMGILHTGDGIKVFSTVINIVKDFVKKEKPEHFFFTAKEKSRIKLYERFIKKMASGYKMTKEKDPYDGEMKYSFKKK